VVGVEAHRIGPGWYHLTVIDQLRDDSSYIKAGVQGIMKELGKDPVYLRMQKSSHSDYEKTYGTKHSYVPVCRVAMWTPKRGLIWAEARFINYDEPSGVIALDTSVPMKYYSARGPRTPKEFDELAKEAGLPTSDEVSSRLKTASKAYYDAVQPLLPR
jgi:hypothetical protein